MKFPKILVFTKSSENFNNKFSIENKAIIC